jgi:polygalacturonase
MVTDKHTGMVRVLTEELISKSSLYFKTSLKMKNPNSSRPDHFIVIDDATNILIKNLYIQNWPVHCFDITGSTGVTITGLTLDNSAGDAPNAASSGLPAAHNSDGFDISSTTNLVLSNTIVKNQDDCVAITSGTNITVTGMTCSGGQYVDFVVDIEKDLLM